MSIFNSILFGIIQGLSEFFPISSSAHLSILGNLFGMSNADSNYLMYCVFVHFGSLLAIIINYLQDIWDMIYQIGAMKRGGNRSFPAVRLLFMLIISTLPLLALIPLSKYIDKLFFGSIFIGIMLILNGLLLFVSDHFSNTVKDEKSITVSDALIIGFCQLVGAIPGISRIAVTASAAMATGNKRTFAIKYAYLLSIFSLFGVNILHFVQAANYGFSWSNLPSYLIGMAVSFGTGLLAMKLVTGIAQRGSFKGFAYYCWLAGVLFIILTMIF